MDNPVGGLDPTGRETESKDKPKRDPEAKEKGASKVDQKNAPPIPAECYTWETGPGCLAAPPKEEINLLNEAKKFATVPFGPLSQLAANPDYWDVHREYLIGGKVVAKGDTSAKHVQAVGDKFAGLSEKDLKDELVKAEGEQR